MIGLFLAYTAGKSAQRSRARRADLPDGYGTFEFLVIMTWIVLVAAWPVHFGYWLAKKGTHWAWASVTATFVTVMVLAIGMTAFLVVGLVYATIWFSAFLEQGLRAEREAEMQCCCHHHCECD